MNSYSKSTPGLLRVPEIYFYILVLPCVLLSLHLWSSMLFFVCCVHVVEICRRLQRRSKSTAPVFLKECVFTFLVRACMRTRMHWGRAKKGAGRELRKRRRRKRPAWRTNITFLETNTVMLPHLDSAVLPSGHLCLT